MFSHGGNIVTAGRMNLTPEKTEQLLYVHDNYDRVRNNIAVKRLRETAGAQDDSNDSSQEGDGMK